MGSVRFRGRLFVSAPMSDFDMLEDAEEILYPLCLCLNQDFSRVGVGHQKGFVVYRVHRHPQESGTARPPFSTTLEMFFPPKHDTSSSTPTAWEMASLTRGTNAADRRPSEDAGEIGENNLMDTFTDDPRLLGSTRAEMNEETRKKCGEGGEDDNDDDDDGARERGDGFDDEAEGKQQTPLEGAFTDPDMAQQERSTKRVPSTSFDPNSRLWEWQRSPVPSPTEMGVGVMALLYKTQFVAVVGGGPYPIGPRNVVKLFITGSVWADRSVRVPDPVEALRLDHWLLIILTTTELRMHNFETDQCVFALPLRDRDAPSSILLTQKGSVLAEGFFSAPAVNQEYDAQSSSKNRNSLNAAETVATRYDVPFAIDYDKKCFAFRSSLRGFSLVRYDTELSHRDRVFAELLATMPNAHQHALASLAMYLVGDIRGSRSNAVGECGRWHIATCSERATLIRIWRFYEKTETPADSSDVADAGDRDDEHPGFFLMVKEVRNESTPTPIFQMGFIGDNFLFCISQNTLKIFFVGESEEPKPYDISTKDPSKTMRAQNNQSSLRHLGLVSAFFRSEWAACTCPLPLTDGAFLPKWVHASSGPLRKHLLRGLTSCGHGHEPRDAGGERSVSADAANSVSSPSGTRQSSETSRGASAPASQSATTDFSALFGRYVSMQVPPLLENANKIARRYWGFGGNSGDSRAVEERESKVSDDVFEQREHTMMADVAQSVVLWWEQPAYWQLEYMTNASTRSSTSLGDASLPRAKCPEAVQLYCVTCDGAAVSFEFNPMEGTVECGAAAAVLRHEE